jgi:hypothetical protein
MDKIEIVRMAVEAVRQYDAKQKKSRHDRRLYNTRQLMKNYNVLIDHCEQSISKVEDIQVNESPIDILDDLDDLDKDTYIEAIRRSNTRTYIIMAHIKEMLDMLKIYCERTGNERKYRILYNNYVEGEALATIAEREHVDKRTVYRDIDFALEKLAALIFGVDGLALMS